MIFNNQNIMLNILFAIVHSIASMLICNLLFIFQFDYYIPADTSVCVGTKGFFKMQYLVTELDWITYNIVASYFFINTQYGKNPL